MANIQELIRRFEELYGKSLSAEQIRVFHAPGRVNLIGEHTDYNGGYVLPAALTFGTTLLIRKREDNQLGMASTNFALHKQISMDAITYDEADEWMNYPKGIVKELQKSGCRFESGFDLLFHGEIPNGSGLSSSASIEVVTAFALHALSGCFEMDTIDIAKLCQRSENEFNGVQCGIMDQFAVANGRKDHAILLMCDTLEYDLIPFNTGSYQLVIGNTNKRRGLLDSKYNERRSQCEQAVRELRAAFPDLTLLGQLTLAEYNANQHLISDEIIRSRAKHVIEEIDRVHRSIEVLRVNDLEAFGKLMNESHDSLRDLYEVTGAELDAMVNAARSVPGVLGSRMTGAGFGGCTVSLVHEDHIEWFKLEVGRKYTELTGLNAEFYTCKIGNGVEQLI
ncbi:Galactokinase [Paenibacillus plantiphilus]|uniref:Galactokinase n=1 Tax=Paenibacillus plantiphilus TaxID=2905650 RepID=A0ABM9CDI0_9BACL|nr:galactokinase [Paenibacillus plantiphilus]CAH1210841.1 Galactokinase [Paenibacillus plantiphilus]